MLKSITGTPRYLEPGQEASAKQQAYIFRDLLKKHCNVELKGGDVTNCFALLFHKMNWPAVLNNVRGSSQQPYYAMTPSMCESPGVVSRELGLILDVILPKERYTAIYEGLSLSDQLSGKSKSTVRAILDMPMASYKIARTLKGAKIATLLAGERTWDMVDKVAWAVTEEDKENALVYDGRTDTAIIPRHFNSDPLTNAERLVGAEFETGKEVIVPVEDVRFTKLFREKLDPKNSYVLSEHTPSDSVVNALYKTSISDSLARHWFNSGNDLMVTVFFVGKGVRRERLSTFAGESLDRNFDLALLALKEYCGKYNVVFTPIGLNEVRDPEQRWAPEYPNTKSLIHELELEDLRFRKAISRIGEAHSASEGNELLKKAIRTYNEFLVKVAEAIWEDTKEINGRKSVLGMFGTMDMDGELCFGGSPVQRVRKITGVI